MPPLNVQDVHGAVRVAALDDVIASKTWADRPKDREALVELRKLDRREESPSLASHALSAAHHVLVRLPVSDSSFALERRFRISFFRPQQNWCIHTMTRSTQRSIDVACSTAPPSRHRRGGTTGGVVPIALVPGGR